MISREQHLSTAAATPVPRHEAITLPRTSKRRFIRIAVITVVLSAVSYGVISYGARWHFQTVYPPAELFVTASHAPLRPIERAQSPVRIESVTDAATSSADWPCLFGPLHESRAVDQPLITHWPETGPPVLWRVTAGAGYSSPVVSAGRVIQFYRIADEEVITCRDFDTGSELWSYRTPTAYQCPVAYTNGPYSTPLIDAGRVYAIGAEGRLTCLDLIRGELLWSRDLQAEFELPERTFGVGHSPAVWQKHLIVNVGGQRGESGIVSFEKQTGDVLWSCTEFGASYATPRVIRRHDRDLAIVLTREALVCLTAAEGHVLWSLPFESTMLDGENAVTPLIHGDLVLACSYGTGSLCVRLLPDRSFEKVWESKRQLTSQYVSLIGHEGCVYGVHTDFSLRCIDLATGDLRWRQKTELLRSNQLLVNGQLIAVGEHGHLACIAARPEAFELVSLTTEPVIEVQGHIFQSPALVQGRLLIGSEQELVCFDLRPETQRVNVTADKPR